ncbi:hypothetical protein [Microbacterium thalli]|uniref:hypothetical protein n=1 Tax=Microbacterium thalli TaxID=3027921 RepID=UPI002366260F|nr:hypothetical protein [Microbacterium thalli]MDD7930769.1 hypothetical protein [Microbacterium thalli]
MGNVSSPLVKAIEQTWSAIQRRHNDVPEVVVTLASGTSTRGMKLGHFAADRWVRGEAAIHELFIGGEGLARGGVGTLGTLVHEAAHAAAAARGIQDTSRQGRYHNKRFKEIAESFGLALEHDPSIGWSTTTVPDATAARYAAEIRRLDAAITAHRRAEIIGGGGRAKTNNGKAAVCSCGRKIRASLAVLDAGPILCGICGDEFEAEAA